MKEYSDLELNKMMAELEGENKSAVEDCLKSGKIYAEVFKYIDWWALLGPLMVKYKVEIDYLDCECSIWRDDLIEAKATTRFNSESEIPRAIIMCILKSENII